MSKGTFSATAYRVGHGYDIHRLADPDTPGAKPMVLGGIRIPGAKGVVAHSDGDALLHAITDAILGSLAQPDLGSMAPDTDPRNAGANSAEFAKGAARTIRGIGWDIVSIDATVVLEAPKIAAIRAELRKSVAGILGVSQDAVNVKGKTHEGLDAVGRGEAIEVHAIALVMQRPTRQD